LPETVLAAKQRFSRALKLVGPGLADFLIDTCCNLTGLAEAEHAKGWPERSGKIVLQLALDQLAHHYGLKPLIGAGQRGHIHAWHAPEEKKVEKQRGLTAIREGVGWTVRRGANEFVPLSATRVFAHAFLFFDFGLDARQPNQRAGLQVVDDIEARLAGLLVIPAILRGMKGGGGERRARPQRHPIGPAQAEIGPKMWTPRQQNRHHRNPENRPHHEHGIPRLLCVHPRRGGVASASRRSIKMFLCALSRSCL
jgi:hypothetical protein